MSGAWGTFVSTVRRLTRSWRRAIGGPERGVGWDPHEPTLLGLAIVLLIAGIIFPWWGFSSITFDPVRGTEFGETFQFNPWLTTRWYAIVFPGGFFVEATPLLWWDFPSAFPRYAEYKTMSTALCALWTVGLLLIAFAFWARRAPRRRLGGLPTLEEAGAAGFIGAAIIVAYFGFPVVGEFASFAGGSEDGPFQWGPGLGWYFATVALVLLILAARAGLRVDRNLKGVCWFCFRPVSGPLCEYCHRKQ